MNLRALLCATLSSLASCALFPVAALAAEDPRTESPEESAAPVQLERFEVTGSLIKRVEFEGPSPVRLITREEIERAGATGLTDVLREMPEMPALFVNEATTTTGIRGASGLDLRGIGPYNTLILVNGRRQAPNGIQGGGVVIVDPNRFPAAMIERVEILKDGASAIYGADAAAGVVNIILRKNYRGAEVSARYGGYACTDAAERAFSLIAGGSRGPVRATLGLTYSARSALAARDLALTANADQTEYWRALDPVKYADTLQPTATGTSSFDLRSTAGPFATVAVPTVAQLTAPRNGLTAAAIINPLTGVTSVFLPGTGGAPAGTIGNSANPASVPRTGNSGRPAAAAFVPRAYNSSDASNSYNFQELAWLTPATERFGVNADLGWTIRSGLDAYATLAWSRLRSETQLAPAPISTGGDNAILVPASNYYNPFGIPVAFTYRPLDFGPRIADITSDSLSAVLGIRGDIFDRFEWDLGWTWSGNEATDLTTNALSESKLRAALAKSTPDAFNIFGGRAFKNDPATLDSIRVRAGQSGNSSIALADFRVTSSEALLLPTGPLGTSIALEHRLERFNVTNDDLISTLDDIVGSSRGSNPTRSRRDVQSVAAELRLPLIPSNRWRWMHTAELSTAARFERFSDGYDSGIAPFVGLRLRLTPRLLLRASYSEVFRAPTLPQLYNGVLDITSTGIADLRRPVSLTGDSADGTTAPRLVRAGGNPKLLPEDGETRQVGLIYDFPGFLTGLSAEVTAGRIEQNNVIVSGLSTLFIRQNELGSTADLIIREAGTETYTNNTAAPISVLTGPNNATTSVAPGQSINVPGRIVRILNAAVNLARQEVEYYDYSLRYRRSLRTLGTFTASTVWSYYAALDYQRLPTDVPFRFVGRDTPRYKGTTAIGWQQRDWNVSLSQQYTHRFRDLAYEGWEVPRYYTYHLTVGRSFGDRAPLWLRRTQLTLGCDNLLDRDFPLDVTAEGYNKSTIARPAGRYFFVSLKRTL